MLSYISRLLIPLLFVFTSTVFAQEPLLPTVSSESNVIGTATAEPAQQVVFKTNLGNIEITLYPKEAPVTVKNFLAYVDSGFYDDSIFHRVIPGFVIQGGGFNDAMEPRKTKDPIINESSNGLENLSGTLAMARTPKPDSATSQFFINLENNPFLNATPSNPGYAVFGKVTKGLDIVLLISSAKTGTFKQHQNVPLKPIHLISASRKTVE